MSKARDQSFTLIFGLLASVMLALMVLPLAALALRAPWSRLGDIFGDAVTLDAIGVSFVASLGAVAITLVFGFPLAWILARASFPGRNLVRLLVTLPMVFPPVVGGVALFAAFGRRGVLGPVLESLGVQLSFSTLGAVMASTFVAAPFFILTAESALRNVDRKLEDAAATMGASRWMILRTVTLPAIAPTALAGLALTWARALGEFGATITFAGNLQGETQTMPLAVHQLFQGDFEGAMLLSLILVGLSFLVLATLRGRAMAQ